MRGDTFEQGRLRSEAEFHDEWATRIDPASTLVDETFTSVTALENQYILGVFGELKGKRILDYGCGAAEGGIYLAKQGAIVVGMDVSAGMLNAAERLATHHGVSIETRQVTGARIPADDAEFDLIYGNGVLHHVPLDSAVPELARVLKRNGTACFIEPLPYNPVINVYRRLAKEVRTEDEQPLSFSDVDRLKASFEHVSHREFWLTALGVFLRFYVWERVDPNEERYWKKIYTDAPRLESFFNPLKRMDDWLLKHVPPLRWMCWNTVVMATQPRHP